MRVRKNENAKYEVVCRYTHGVNVLGYGLIDKDGKPMKVRKEVFEEMALDNMIYNCSANIYNDRVNLRGIGMKLKDLKTYNLKERNK